MDNRYAQQDKIAAVDGLNHGSAASAILFHQPHKGGGRGIHNQYADNGKNQQAGRKGRANVRFIQVAEQECRQENGKHQTVDSWQRILAQQP